MHEQYKQYQCCLLTVIIEIVKGPAIRIFSPKNAKILGLISKNKKSVARFMSTMSTILCRNNLIFEIPITYQ